MAFSLRECGHQFMRLSTPASASDRNCFPRRHRRARDGRSRSSRRGPRQACRADCFRQQGRAEPTFAASCRGRSRNPGARGERVPFAAPTSGSPAIATVDRKEKAKNEMTRRIIRRQEQHLPSLDEARTSDRHSAPALVELRAFPAFTREHDARIPARSSAGKSTSNGWCVFRDCSTVTLSPDA